MAKNPRFVAMGKLGGAAGTGPMKARPSEVARKAAQIRWAKTKPTATTALDNWNKKHEK